MSAAPGTVAVAVAVEDRLQFFLQQHRRRSLRHPVGRIGHPEQAHAFPMILRYLHAPHRPREVTPRGHPVPQLVEIVPQLPGEQADADRVHARRPVIGPDLLPRLHDEALVDLKRLHLRLGPGPGLLPRRVGPGLTLVCTAPSLRPHYRTFTATTSRPVPVPRLGTLPLAVRAARGPPSRGQPGWLAFRSRPPLSGRQVLLFLASARDELTPPLHRAPPGQHAGHPLAEGTPARAFAPEALYPPGFDAIVPPTDASAVVHARSSSRRTPDPLTAGPFPATLTTPAPNRRSLPWSGLPACTANPEDLPPSLAQHGSRRRPSTPPHSPFRTHHRTAAPVLAIASWSAKRGQAGPAPGGAAANAGCPVTQQPAGPGRGAAAGA